MYLTWELGYWERQGAAAPLSSASRCKTCRTFCGRLQVRLGREMEGMVCSAGACEQGVHLI